MSIIVPPSAKPIESSPNLKTMRVGDHHIAFDEHSNEIHVVGNYKGLKTFTNNVDLDRYLETVEPTYAVRYHTVNLPFHAGDIDDYLHEMGITIENRVQEPWDVEFSGSRFALMCMINDHWHSFQSDREAFELAVASIRGTTPDYSKA